jgi:TM2 domain-containing membrane protein YozV
MKKNWILCSLIIFSFIFLVNYCTAQTADSTAFFTAKEDTVKFKKHSPKTASWLAVVPGAGQIYNKKYWKLTMVYGGMGATGYLIYHYGYYYSFFRKEYLARIFDDIEAMSMDPDILGMSAEGILQTRNIYRRNMEISIAACAIVYLLSIVDASVDAHLFYYDVSDNLSFGVIPKIDINPITRITTPTVAFVLKF